MSVNNVSAVNDAIKYLNGLELKEEQQSITNDLKSSIFSPINAVFGGLEVSSSLKTAYGADKLKDVFTAIKSGTQPASAEVSKDVVKQLKNVYAKTEAAVAKKAQQKAAGAASGGIFSKIGSVFKSGGAAIKKACSSAMGAIGKTSVGTAIKGAFSKFGGTAVGSALKSAGSKVGVLLKGTGALGMAAFEGVIGIVTEVIPAFSQGGVSSGVKQLGKTGVKAAGTGLGWAAGSAVGEAVGLAVGSIFPGVGNVIGGAVGKFIGGIAGSIIGGGIGKKIAGKSETEKLQEKQLQDTATEIAQDPNQMNELNQLVTTQVQEEIANGTADEDTEKMAAYLNNGAFFTSNYNPNVTDYPQENYNQAQYNTQTQPATNYWAQMAERIQQGDTSMYKITDDKLQSVFANQNAANNTNTSTNAASSPSFTSNNIINQDDLLQDGRTNYFAIG